MGLQVVCDCGCGGVVSDLSATVAHGYMKKVYYLPECSAKLENFIKARDLMHTRVANDFRKKLDKLKADFIKVNPNAKLPDSH